MSRSIAYGRQKIDDEDIEAVIRVLRSDYITQGPMIERFEEALKGYCGADYAVLFNSGTSALHGAYFAAGISNGDEVITTPITFAATANAALYLGARPVFVDIEPDTGNMDVSNIEGAITETTKAIVPVHFGGHPVDIGRLSGIARKNGIKVIEDGCHALGASYRIEEIDKWIKIGSCTHSDMTVFSFHPVKHITTGEGGAVMTNSRDYYERLIMFRNHGITKKVQDFIAFNPSTDGPWYYEQQLLGYNYRMTDIQAALGLSQLKKLDRFLEKRRVIAERYNLTFSTATAFQIPPQRSYAIPSWHLYPLRLRQEAIYRKYEIVTAFREKGIYVQVHYIPVYLHPYYQGLGYRKGLCPKAEGFYLAELSIPIYPAMTQDDVDYVIQTIQELL